MAAGQLGIGIRVWVGWTNSSTEEGRPHLCSFGTIIAGPSNDLCDSTEIYENFWEVELDNGYIGYAVERILFPVDDDGEDSIENVKELETA
tara:strand:+ start:2871 stop:3143 length:273 start_codon:yes stop_codon:yes gene_type:complete